MQDKVFDQFESLLDVTGFVSMQTNLAILIKLLMTRKQILLFKYQHDRALTQYKKPQSSSSSGEDGNPPSKLPELGLINQTNHES